MKYEQTDKWFLLPRYGVVQPYNAELDKDRPDVSWSHGSHGITHFRTRDHGARGWCGIDYFEKNAEEVDNGKE